MYVTYEEPLKGKCFTEKQMHEVYRDLADKAEYPDFECWFTDMLKSGVFEKIEEAQNKATANNVVAILANTYIDCANGQTGRKDGDKLCTEKQNSFVSLKAF